MYNPSLHQALNTRFATLLYKLDVQKRDYVIKIEIFMLKGILTVKGYYFPSKYKQHISK